jgi:hypothetical protein
LLGLVEEARQSLERGVAASALWAANGNALKIGAWRQRFDALRTGRAVVETDITRPAARYILAAIAVFKVAALIGLGPIWTPDSRYYASYANLLLASTGWLHDAGLSSTAIPPLTFHSIGYPLVLAAAMRLCGPLWPYLVIALQFVMSFAAAWAIYLLSVSLGLKRRLPLVAAATYMLSLSLLLDQCLLTDSLHASLIVIAVCLLARNIQAEHVLRFKTAVIAGVLLALAFLIREALQYLIAALFPLLGVSIWLAGRTLRSVLTCCLVLLPLIVTVEIYQSWNSYRTGKRFVSTTAQFNIPLALEKAAKSNPVIIAGDTPFERIARQTFRFGNLMEDMVRFDQAMFKEGYDAVDQSSLAYERYFSSWRHHPIEMLTILRTHISEQAAKYTIRPIATICEALDWATDTPDHCYDYRDLLRGVPSLFSGSPPTAAITFVALTLEQTLAILLFSGFFLGVPALVVWHGWSASQQLNASMLIVASFWLVYITWFLGYGVVHFEDRFMAPVLPLSIVGGLFYWRHAFALLSAARARLRGAKSIDGAEPRYTPVLPQVDAPRFSSLRSGTPSSIDA